MIPRNFYKANCCFSIYSQFGKRWITNIREYDIFYFVKQLNNDWKLVIYGELIGVIDIFDSSCVLVREEEETSP